MKSPNSLLKLILFSSISFLFAQEDQFDVVKVSNVPFPKSRGKAAKILLSDEKEVPEFTACYRYLVESYNTGWAKIVTFSGRYSDMLGFETGYEFFGYQALGLILFRDVVGGLRGTNFPFGFHVNLPRNLQTGEWYNFCVAYSSVIQQLQAYGNGLKIASYEYTDESENPLPAFKKIDLMKNFRGLFTDLNVYSTFFGDDEMEAWTSGCSRADGDIYTWDIANVNISQHATLNVSLVKKSKDEVCLDAKQTMQEPSKLASQSDNKIYKPSIPANESFDGQVLEFISDTFGKDAMQCKDRCYRLNGQIMPAPQNKEEDTFLRKALLKRGTTSIHIGGESRPEDYIDVIPDLEERLLKREALFPNGGYYTFYHPVTGVKMNPLKTLVDPAHNTDTYPGKKCIYCNTWLNNEKNDVGFHCMEVSCYETHANSACPCVFTTAPTFKLRGLCKDAVMDTSFKLADQPPGETRSYVGPKGWKVSRNKTDKKWRMTHKSYPDLTLTMLDMDAIPVGRHNWRINNNVCNQGSTNVQTLLMSGCKEEEFTCDDGKCLNITQRCNNIEVNTLTTKSKIEYQKCLL